MSDKELLELAAKAVVPFDESMQDLETIRANFKLLEAEVIRLRATIEAFRKQAAKEAKP